MLIILPWSGRALCLVLVNTRTQAHLDSQSTPGQRTNGFRELLVKKCRQRENNRSRQYTAILKAMVKRIIICSLCFTLFSGSGHTQEPPSQRNDPGKAALIEELMHLTRPDMTVAEFLEQYKLAFSPKA